MFGDFADAFHPDATEARVRPLADAVFDVALHGRGAGRREAEPRAPSYSVHFMLRGVPDDRHELIHGVAPPSSEDDRIV